MQELFTWFLIGMSVIALVVYIALHYFEAGYGYLFDRRYGPPIPNKLGWVLMESPVFIAMTILWLCSERRDLWAPLVLFLLFQKSLFLSGFPISLAYARQLVHAPRHCSYGHVF